MEGVLIIKRFNGIVPPVCTPLSPEGDVDKKSLQTLLEFQMDAEVDGLFILGSSSEGALLTERQRSDVLSVAQTVVGNALPMMIGAIAPSTGAAIEAARAAKKAGATAVVATVPFYGHPDREEVRRHYRALHAATDLPLFVYDVPAAVHSRVPHDVILDLVDEGAVIGVKDSSGDCEGLRKLVAHARSRSTFSVFTGSELLVDTAFLMGVDGAVPGLANVDPHAYVRLYRACMAGKWEDARAEQERLVALADMIPIGAMYGVGAFASGWGSFKTALVLRGVIAHNTMVPPLQSLNGAATKTIASILERAGLLEVTG